MRLDALWTIEYATNHGDFGTGVAVLLGGHIFGGDTNYTYEGSYRWEQSSIVATVRVHLHSAAPVAACVLADGELLVELRGKPVAGELELVGVMRQEPLTQLFVHMTPRSEIPALGDGAARPAGPEWARLPGGAGRPAPDDRLIEESADSPPMY